MTCKDFFDIYQEDQKTNMAHNTFASRTCLVRLNLLPTCGEKEVNDVIPCEIDAIFENMYKSGYANNTVYGAQQAFLSYFKAAMQYYYADHNPVKDARTIRQTKSF